MKFKYRIIWTNIIKGKQEYVDIDDQHIALFVAKKKVSDGMQNVIISVSEDASIVDTEDVSWPAIDVNISEAEKEII